MNLTVGKIRPFGTYSAITCHIHFLGRTCSISWRLEAICTQQSEDKEGLSAEAPRADSAN